MRNRWLGQTFAAAAAVALLLCTAVQAKEKGATAKVGQAAPDFTLQDVRTGQDVKLSDYKGKNTVVITFQSLQCPWNYMRAEAGYERVLFPLAKEWEDEGVVFLAINSNSTESVDQLRSYAEEHNMPYPLLKDPGNQVADVYGGATTPHFYVVDKEGVLRYQGGFEQAPSSPEKCGEMDEKYLEPVVVAIVNGEEPPVTETKPKGCTIKRGS